MRFRVIAMLLAMTVGVLGCAKPSERATTPPPTRAAATPAPRAVATSAVLPDAGGFAIGFDTPGVTTPQPGSPVRTALMDAARSYLGVSSKFIVYRLAVKDGYALADIEPEDKITTPRVVLKFVESAATWRVVGTLVGSTGAASTSPSDLARQAADYVIAREIASAKNELELARIKAEGERLIAENNAKADAEIAKRRAEADWNRYVAAYKRTYETEKGRLVRTLADRGLESLDAASIEAEVDRRMRELGFTVKP